MVLSKFLKTVGQLSRSILDDKIIINKSSPMDGKIWSKYLKYAVLVLVAAGAARWMLLSLGPQRPAPAFVAPKRVAQTTALPETLRNILSATNSVDRTRSIQQLRHWLSSLPKDQAASAVRQILASGQDARTGQGFKLNPDGSLSQAPTLRTLLLDMLGKLDPAQAADVAKEILQLKNSADEWSVALALYARVNTTDDALSFLQQKAEEMASYPPWQHNPSVGYLEAFDIFVYTDDTDFVSALSQFTSDKGNPALAHAAFLALDRLVQNDPMNTLETLQDNTALLNGQAATEGGFFARSDVRDPDQKALLAAYLLSSDRTLAELEAFAGLYPNENFMVSPNLLTASPTLSNAELLSRYQAAEQAVSQWLQDSQFSSVWPQLQQIQGRLSRIMNGTAP